MNIPEIGKQSSFGEKHFGRFGRFGRQRASWWFSVVVREGWDGWNKEVDKGIEAYLGAQRDGVVYGFCCR